MEAALAPDVPAKPGHVFELAPDVARQWFGDTGTYARMGVEGDGSCFYHSVCAVLNMDNYLHEGKDRQAEIAHAFRCQFQRVFTESRFEHLAAGTSTGKTYTATKEALCTPHVWADEVMIKHAAAVLNMNLVFLDMSRGAMYCGVHGAETLESASPRRKERGKKKPRVPKQPTAVIAWVSKSHFEPIVRLEKLESEKALIRGLFEPAKNKTDATMVTHLMRAYTAHCSDKVHDAAV